MVSQKTNKMHSGYYPEWVPSWVHFVRFLERLEETIICFWDNLTFSVSYGPGNWILRLFLVRYPKIGLLMNISNDIKKTFNSTYSVISVCNLMKTSSYKLSLTWIEPIKSSRFWFGEWKMNDERVLWHLL